MQHPKYSYLIRFTIILSILLSKNALSQEQEANSASGQESELPPAVSFSFSTDLQYLSKNNKADEAEWIDIAEGKILLLKYLSKGRKDRGNAIILHAQGENPAHQRLTFPLSTQLSSLGWQVWVPAIPEPDYPDISQTLPLETNKVSEDSDNSPSTENISDDSGQSNGIGRATGLTKVYFANSQSYQKFFNELMSKVSAKIPGSKRPVLLIGNQKNAFWMLNNENSNFFTHLVLIAPEVPNKGEEQLKSKFESQSAPVYIFLQEGINSAPFTKAIANGFWKSKFQRLNRSILSPYNQQEESVMIGKTITGWITAQNKQK
ncbi:DUF3530 family protein [Aliikangiella sp. G2MR2-5]|uniref:DUF3530 family protein n=1 Tax=Aliikangiella sp. G2MR2-5 TaxID=2788943 RepID=UPI0018A91A94|nr:DUF3530 family protein [Aliikangiella sp. G2MR2-5]